MTRKSCPTEQGIKSVDETLDEIRYGPIPRHKTDRELIQKVADKFESAYNKERASMIRVKNACVEKCALELDSHIEAIIHDVARRKYGEKNG